MSCSNPSLYVCLWPLYLSTAFEKLNDGTVDLLIPKLIYIGINGIFLAMGLWKCGKMGLLPTTSADWLSYIVRKDILENSGVPLSL